MESKFHCSYSGLSSVMSYTLDIDRIIEMAWEDRTPFEPLNISSESKRMRFVRLLRENLKRSSFEMSKELRVERLNIVKHPKQKDLKVKIKK